jgi:hypothetical protein
MPWMGESAQVECAACFARRETPVAPTGGSGTTVSDFPCSYWLDFSPYGGMLRANMI